MCTEIARGPDRRNGQRGPGQPAQPEDALTELGIGQVHVVRSPGRLSARSCVVPMFTGLNVHVVSAGVIGNSAGLARKVQAIRVGNVIDRQHRRRERWERC